MRKVFGKRDRNETLRSSICNVLNAVCHRGEQKTNKERSRIWKCNQRKAMVKTNAAQGQPPWAALFRGCPACLRSLDAKASALSSSCSQKNHEAANSTSRSLCVLALSSRVRAVKHKALNEIASPGQPVTWHRVRIHPAFHPRGPTDSTACTTSGRALRTSHALTANTLREAHCNRNGNYSMLCEETVEERNFLWKATENEEQMRSRSEGWISLHTLRSMFTG